MKSKYKMGDYVKFTGVYHHNYPTCRYFNMMRIIEIKEMTNQNYGDLLILSLKNSNYACNHRWCYQDDECLNKNREDKLKKILNV